MDQKFLKTKVINLDRRPDRWKRFEDLVKDIKLKHYVRFNAVDGQTIKRTDERLLLLTKNRFRYRRGIVGAALSHFTLWRELVDSDYEYYFILEDDVNFYPNFKEKLNQLIDILKKDKLPLILMGFTTGDKILNSYQEKNNVEINKVSIEMNSKIWGGLFGYIINREFAEKVVEDLETNGMVSPADTTILSYVDDIYYTSPIMVYSSVMTYLNRTDSDIQYDMLGVFDDYKFYSGLDSPGYDISYHPKAKFSFLKNLADQDPNCVGFNTWGYLKYKIRNPSEFITIPKMKSTTQGLYVKSNN